MTKSPSDIDHLSQSSMKTYMTCPAQWAATYLEGRPRRIGAPLVKGSAVDKVAELNWNQKRRTGTDVPLEEAQEIAEDAFRAKVDEAGGRSEIDWGNEGMGAALDSVQRMTVVHMRDHAPLITPVATQVLVRRRTKGGRDFIGYIDAVTDEGIVIDVKTGGRKASQSDADIDLQPSAYAWALGKPIEFTYLRVIDSGRSPAYSEVVFTHRGQSALTWFEELVNNISDLIDNHVYPAIPGWGCSYCPLQNTCSGALTNRD